MYYCTSNNLYDDSQRQNPNTNLTPFIDPGSIQGQPSPSFPIPLPFPLPWLLPQFPSPTPPFSPPITGGCLNRWSRVRLRGGRVLSIYVTFIGPNSIGGFLPNRQQIALNLDEIVEMTC